MTEKVAIVFGTYQRLNLLRRAVKSIRMASGTLSYTIIIVDGGSTDGTQAWLSSQKNIILIQQQGPLTGPVRAFNLGFSRAVHDDFDYIVNFNDDAEFVTVGAIEKAISVLRRDRLIGQVAFEFYRRQKWQFQRSYGRTYANYGVVRKNIGMLVAKSQGDASGCNWWNPIYNTYAGDSEFSLWIWKLGYRVHEAKGLRIYDYRCDDNLRKVHQPKTIIDQKIYHVRWKNAFRTGQVLTLNQALAKIAAERGEQRSAPAGIIRSMPQSRSVRSSSNKNARSRRRRKVSIATRIQRASRTRLSVRR